MKVKDICSGGGVSAGGTSGSEEGGWAARGSEQMTYQVEEQRDEQHAQDLLAQRGRNLLLSHTCSEYVESMRKSSSRAAHPYRMYVSLYIPAEPAP